MVCQFAPSAYSSPFLRFLYPNLMRVGNFLSLSCIWLYALCAWCIFPLRGWQQFLRLYVSMRGQCGKMLIFDLLEAVFSFERLFFSFRSYW